MENSISDLLENWENEAEVSEDRNPEYSDGIQNCITDLRQLKKELQKMLEGPPFDSEAFLFGTIKIKEILGENE